MNARELLTRVIAEFEKNGVTLNNVYSNVWRSDHEYKSGERRFYVSEVYRHNGTEENTTVKIIVDEVNKVWGAQSCSLIEVIALKVPKNASDRVIANRVKKAIEAYNAR